jgi:hypothetical protein
VLGPGPKGDAVAGPFNLGWHPVEPGPGPRSKLLDDPPRAGAAGLVSAYRQWRADVEADEARLLQAHLSGPVWHPVRLPDDVHVVPVYGGTAEAVEQLVTTMVTSGLESGMASCRVVNLSGWDLTGGLRRQMGKAQKNRAQFEQVSARGSTVNLFGNPDASELLALLVAALRVSSERSAGRQSQEERQELERVVRLLRGPVSLERVIDAVDVALGSTVNQWSLTVDEVRDLQDYFGSVISQRRASQDRLSDLHVNLHALRGFAKSPRMAPDVVGSGRLSIRWFDVGSGRSSDELELGRQLVARAVLQTFTTPGPEELLVVVGAERLSDEVSDDMVSSAQRLGKRLMLLYTKMTDAASRTLGYAGSSFAVFLRLPHHQDAQTASEYVGREYKFVVNGISIAEGQTQDWSDAYGTSTSRGRSVSHSASRTSGFGAGAFAFSRQVGTSVTSSFDSSSSQTRTRGGGSSTTSTTSAGRVHEYVVEPEVFQKMPEELMLVVADDTVTVASCANDIRWSKQVSSHYLAIP